MTQNQDQAKTAKKEPRKPPHGQKGEDEGPRDEPRSERDPNGTIDAVENAAK